MKKAITLLLIGIVSIPLFSQNKENLNSYRPKENVLYKKIEEGIGSTKIKNIKMLYNEKGAYSYSEERSFEGKGKTLIFELYGEKPEIQLSIKNLSLSKFDKVLFNVFNVSEILIDDCTFTDIVGGVSFEFKEKLNGKKKKSSIIISNSNFEDYKLEKGKTNYYDQLKFGRNKYAKGLASLENVTIEDCKFVMQDSSYSWLIKSAHKTYPKRHSINFFRISPDAAYSNITVKNNKFTAAAPYYRTEAITLVNDQKSDFRKPEDLYNYNKKICIVDNEMSTTSEDPGHGIFVQGPYRSVKINENEIKNFGMNIFDGKKVGSDGAIRLYGARAAKYSDDIIDSEVIGNIIQSGNAVINLSGTRNSLVKDNTIEILPWPQFFEDKKDLVFDDRMGIRITTGDHSDLKKGNENIRVEDNIINCNKEKACVGILMQSTKDFIITGNRINEPTNFGILIFGHKNEKVLDIGSSKIEGNVIDYKGQKLKNLSTNFYKYKDMNFAAIKVYRMDNGKKYSNESLMISENKVIDNSNSIPKTSINDQTKSELKKNTVSDIQIED